MKLTKVLVPKDLSLLRMSRCKAWKSSSFSIGVLQRRGCCLKLFFLLGGVFQFDSPLGEIIKYNGFEHKSPKIEFESLFCHFTCHVRVTYFFLCFSFLIY